MIPGTLFDAALIAQNYSGANPSVGTLWANRVVTNGGSAPSSGTISAIDTFYAALVTAGIDTKMKAIGVFAPDNLTAARTPLIVGAGSDPWSNTGFSSGDLTVNGLLGGTGKVLGSGLVPSSIFSTDNSAGISVYVSTITGSAAFEVGRFGTGDVACFQLSVDYTDTKTRFNCWENVDFNGETQATSAALAGFYSASRTASNVAKIYFANSTHSWAQQGSTNTLTVGGSHSNVNNALAIMASQSATGTILSPTDRRVSFVAIHDGLTSTEGSALYNAVQALRTAFGGGYV